MILMFLFSLFSTQTPSDISQSGTCGTGCKSSGLGRGTVDVSVVVSGTACLHNPSATVGTVKYPMIPISMKITYTELELSNE